MDTITAVKPVILIGLAVAGSCFVIGGAIDLARRKGSPVLMGAYVTGGSALILVALALLLRGSEAPEPYGPADPAAPMISELMDEIRQMEHTS